jgi:hypothetical protein
MLQSLSNPVRTAGMTTNPPKEDDEIPTPQGIENIPTIYADTTFLTYWGDRMKMSFAEQIDEKWKWHSSVIMPRRSLKKFVRQLQDALKEMESIKDETDE